MRTMVFWMIRRSIRNSSILPFRSFASSTAFNPTTAIGQYARLDFVQSLRKQLLLGSAAGRELEASE